MEYIDQFIDYGYGEGLENRRDDHGDDFYYEEQQEITEAEVENQGQEASEDESSEGSNQQESSSIGTEGSDATVTAGSTSNLIRRNHLKNDRRKKGERKSTNFLFHIVRKYNKFSQKNWKKKLSDPIKNLLAFAKKGHFDWIIKE